MAGITMTLTNAAGGSPQAVGNPKGYMFNAKGTQHVIYRGESGSIHELWLGSSGWQHNELTLTGGPTNHPPSAASDPKGYVFEAQGTQHVIYRSDTGRSEGANGLCRAPPRFRQVSLIV